MFISFVQQVWVLVLKKLYNKLQIMCEMNHLCLAYKQRL